MNEIRPITKQVCINLPIYSAESDSIDGDPSDYILSNMAPWSDVRCKSVAWCVSMWESLRVFTHQGRDKQMTCEILACKYATSKLFILAAMWICDPKKNIESTYTNCRQSRTGTVRKNAGACRAPRGHTAVPNVLQIERSHSLGSFQLPVPDPLRCMNMLKHYSHTNKLIKAGVEQQLQVSFCGLWREQRFIQQLQLPVQRHHPNSLLSHCL